MFTRIYNWYKNLPEQKKYVELITAVLSVPVLLSVLTLNISNINSKKSAEPETNPTDAVRENVVFVPITGLAYTDSNPKELNDGKPTSNIDTPCIKEIGPIEMVSPKDQETVRSNPVKIQIDYDQGEYCSVVWAYRINGADWSDYDDSSIALYDMTPGSKTIEIKIKSLASKQEKILIRSFEYNPPYISPAGSSDTNATSSADNDV